VKDIFTLLKHGLHGTLHTQVRFHRRMVRTIKVENGVLVENKFDEKVGVSIRVYDGGRWGFSHTWDISEVGIKNALKKALDGLHALHKEKGAPTPRISPITGEFYPPSVNVPAETISLKDKVDFLLGLDRALKKEDSRIVLSTIRYTEMVDEKYIINTDGTSAYTRYPNLELIVFAAAEENEEREEYAEGIGITGGWQDILDRKPLQIINKVGKVLIQNLHAPYPESGESTVILGPELVGLLSHEAIGHTVEADFVLAGSTAKGKQGQMVASPLITLVDHPHPEFAPHASGWIPFDDEGSEAREAVIIEKGAVVGYMTDSITSAHLGMENTGNGRAWTYMDEPIVRMRNTYILPGENTLEEMIEATEDGYLMLTAFGGGQADANGEFMFGVGEAYRIKGGEVLHPVKSATISGQAFTVLQNVDMLGRDIELSMGTGYCGKFQPAKVDGGGPHLRTRLKIGGKRS